MLRYLPQPFDTRILHLGIGVEPFGNSVADEGGSLLLEQLDLPPLLFDQRIDPRRLAVQKGGNGALFIKWAKGKSIVISVSRDSPGQRNPLR